MQRIGDLKYMFNRFLGKDVILRDPGDKELWHVGTGTDLELLVFHANLTESDKKFLKSLRVKV